MKTSPFLYSVYSLSLVSALIVTSCVPPATQTKPTGSAADPTVNSLTKKPNLDHLVVLKDKSNAKSAKGFQQKSGFSTKTSNNINGEPLSTSGLKSDFLSLTYSGKYDIPVDGYPPISAPETEEIGLSLPSLTNLEYSAVPYTANDADNNPIRGLTVTFTLKADTDTTKNPITGESQVGTRFQREVAVNAKFESLDGVNYTYVPPASGNNGSGHYNFRDLKDLENPCNSPYLLAEGYNISTYNKVVPGGKVVLNREDGTIEADFSFDYNVTIGAYVPYFCTGGTRSKTWHLPRTSIKFKAPMNFDIQDTISLNAQETLVGGELRPTAFLSVDTTPDGQAWSLEIKNPSTGEMMRSISGTGDSDDISWAVKDIEDGNYQATVTNAVGQTSEVNLQVDNTPPEFVSIEKGTDYGDEVDVLITVRDPVVNGVSAGLKSVSYGEVKLVSGNEAVATFRMSHIAADVLIAAFDGAFGTASLVGGDFGIKQVSDALEVTDMLDSFQVASYVPSICVNKKIPGSQPSAVKTNNKKKNQVTFRGVFDFDNKPIFPSGNSTFSNSRDVTLVFHISDVGKPYPVKSPKETPTQFGQRLQTYKNRQVIRKKKGLKDYFGDGFLKNISVKDLVTGSTAGKINPTLGENAYGPGSVANYMRYDKYTDALYTRGGAYDFALDWFGCKVPNLSLKAEHNGMLLFVSVNATALSGQTAVKFQVSIPSNDKKVRNTKICQLSIDNTKTINWGKADCN